MRKMRGLKNPGCLCYLISLLQQFQSIPRVRQLLLTLQMGNCNKSSDSDNSSDCSDSDVGNNSSSNRSSSSSDNIDAWVPSRSLSKALLSARKLLKQQKREAIVEPTSAEKKLSKQRKYLIQFLTQFQLLLAYLASSPLPDSDSDSEVSDTDYNSDIDNNSDQSSSENDEISIIPFYQSIQKLTNEKENLSKPRDCAEFFSKICKVFLLFLQDSFFREQFPLIYNVAHKFLLIFRGFVRHTVSPITWESTQASSPEIQQIESYYYLSIDISPGNLLLSLERFIAPSTPFLFPWPTSSTPEESTRLLTFKCDELLCSVPSTYQHITLPSHSAAILSTKEEHTEEITENSTVSNININNNINSDNEDIDCPTDTAPEVLVLHLRRFAIDFDAQWKAKRFDYFSFPSQLSFGNYLQCAQGSTNENHMTVHHAAYHYELQGVIVHTGLDADDGHYISLVRELSTDKDAEASAKESCWYWCDDETVQQYNSEELPSLFGDQHDEDEQAIDVPETNDETASHALEKLTLDERNNNNNNHDTLSENNNSEEKDEDAVAMMLFYLRVPPSQQSH